MDRKLMKLKKEVDRMERDEQKLLGSLDTHLTSFRELIEAEKDISPEELMEIAEKKLKKLKAKYDKIEGKFQKELEMIDRIKDKLKEEEDD